MYGLSTTTLPKDKPQIITSRIVNAPRDLLFKLLTTPDHIKHFWGPDGFTNSISKMEVKQGRQWLFTMHGPDGKDWPNRIIYRDVKSPSYLGWDHDGGEDDTSGHRFFGELELHEVTADKTRVELRMTEATMDARDFVAQFAVAGGIQNLERFAAYVAPMVNSLNRFVIERDFAVSQQRLFDACTNVDEMTQWFSSPGSKVIHSEMDFKPGGVYHYGTASADGKEMWGKVTYREITPPKSVLYMQSFSDREGNITSHPMAPTWPKEMVTVFEFISLGANKTKLKITWTYAGIDDAEAATFQAAHAGMTQGWTGSLNQLEQYVMKQA